MFNHKKLYFLRDVYTVGETLTFNGSKLKAKIASYFSIKFDIPVDRYNDWLTVCGDNYHLKINIKYCSDLEDDAYKLVVSKKKYINIAAKNSRGILYAIDVLGKIIRIYDNKIVIPIIVIEDKPSFKIRGIIEGFYGEPWSFDDRKDAIKFLSNHRMNTYMYAPKDDVYHRKLWRELYPSEELTKLKELKKICDDFFVDFYYCISPGNDFDYTNVDDFNFLKAKLNQLIEIGINNFAVLMDDIDYNLNGKNKNIFKRPGIAHGYICNEINSYLREKLIEYTLIMCPTEYYQNWDTEYRNDLKSYLNKEITIFWTGYNTIAEVISNKDGEKVKDYFGHDLILWDNYPVNDVSKDRIFLGPVVNRGTMLNRTHIGIVSNPMNQWQLSKVALITFFHYMWNSEKYNPELSWSLAIDEMGGNCSESFKFFCENNRNSLIYYYKNEELVNAIENQNIEYLDNYFKDFMIHINNIEKMDNKKLVKELQPWIRRFKLDFELWNSIIKKDKREIDKKIKKCLEYEYTIGSNIALTIAKKWGYTDKDITRRKRINFWEE